MFAKILSISDTLMWRYYTLLRLPPRPISPGCGRGRGRAQSEGRQGDAGQGDHHALHTRRRPRPPRPTSPTARAAASRRDSRGVAVGAPLGIGALLKQANLAPSSSEAMRLVDGGGVRIDGAVVSDKGP